MRCWQAFKSLSQSGYSCHILFNTFAAGNACPWGRWAAWSQLELEQLLKICNRYFRLLGDILEVIVSQVIGVDVESIFYE